MTGLVFDIKEFAIHDGGGIRTTVFLKGCPLRCAWCHNPEGLNPEPELFIKHNRCKDCGLCKRPCAHPECQDVGRCLHICPEDALSVAGVRWESSALAEKLLRSKTLFDSTGGGVTISGGEPLLQQKFTKDLLFQLKGRVHTAIETSGFASSDTFRDIIKLCDFVYMDLKIADADEHKKYTGVSNGIILENANILKSCGVAHSFRTPLIPGITDTEKNLSAIAQVVGNSPWEKLPYNNLAPAKYESVGRKFSLDIK